MPAPVSEVQERRLIGIDRNMSARSDNDMSAISIQHIDVNDSSRAPLFSQVCEGRPDRDLNLLTETPHRRNELPDRVYETNQSNDSRRQGRVTNLQFVPLAP